MKKLLIIGALPFDDERLTLYETMINNLKNEFDILSPIDTMNFGGTQEKRYKRAFNGVKWADIIIAECSEVSSGQGMEIRESTILGKQLFVIAKKESKISSLIKASPNLEKIIYYNDLKDLELKLKDICN